MSTFSMDNFEIPIILAIFSVMIIGDILGGFNQFYVHFCIFLLFDIVAVIAILFFSEMYETESLKIGLIRKYLK